MSICPKSVWLVVLPLVLLLFACGSSGGEQADSEIPSSDATGVEAPAGAEGEFETDFSEHGVPYEEISSGGPPKDGILSRPAPRGRGAV